MLSATVATHYDELKAIHELNRQNLKDRLTDEERRKGGFVTWLYSLALLEQLHAIAPSIIIKDGNAVVAYALTATKEAGSFHVDLKKMIAHVDELPYNSRPLSIYRYYCMGQICIHTDYRGQGLVDRLYQHHKKIYSPQYDLLITEISSANPRSQRAHEKVGFKTIHTYTDPLDEWNVVVWDWRNETL